MARQIQRLAGMILLTLFSLQVVAARFTGQVTDATDGSPLADVMVTVINAAEEHRQTVCTDAEGR
ncbi:MAG: hypothetical protein U5K56_13040 [Halioglobus sp.]|nr:hypothetical protein [Halioglobus sp.]